jgi:AraC-like DNA-binding protein
MARKIIFQAKARSGTFCIKLLTNRIYMIDRLQALLNHFSVSARTFQFGPLCGINSLSDEETHGQLHLVTDGAVEVWHGPRLAFSINEPSLLFYPRPMAHRFVTDPELGADFVCANIAFEGGAATPLAVALPSSIVFPLSEIPDSQPVLEVLFAEAKAYNCGRQAIIDRLFEVIVIQLLRHMMEGGITRVGLLAGLAHPQLKRAIVAMHEAPERNWRVEDLAAVAGMSRSVFSNLFHGTVGEPPASYLQRRRIGLVQKWLKRGLPIRLIAEEAGYGSESSLSRAFKAQCGLSPKAWLNAEKSMAAGQ